MAINTSYPCVISALIADQEQQNHKSIWLLYLTLGSHSPNPNKIRIRWYALHSFSKKIFAFIFRYIIEIFWHSLGVFFIGKRKTNCALLTISIYPVMDYNFKGNTRHSPPPLSTITGKWFSRIYCFRFPISISNPTESTFYSYSHVCILCEVHIPKILDNVPKIFWIF